jgi:hypothetical protein
MHRTIWDFSDFNSKKSTICKYLQIKVDRDFGHNILKIIIKFWLIKFKYV